MNSSNQVIPAEAVDAVPEYLRGSDNATTVRAILARIEGLNTDGTKKEPADRRRTEDGGNHK